MDGSGGYASSLEHVLAELERVDLLVRQQVVRSRRADHERGDGEGDELSDLGAPAREAEPLPPELAGMEARGERLAAAIADAVSRSRDRGVELRLLRLARLLDLDRFDLDVVLVCLAPEIDRRYEHLYAYLDDDVTRRHPTVGVVLDLLCPDLPAELAGRRHLEPPAPLVRHQVVRVVDGPAPAGPSLLGKGLELDARVVRYLLSDGEPEALDERLAPVAELVAPSIGLAALVFPADLQQQLARLAQRLAGAGAGVRDDDLVVYCRGDDGVGKQAVAEALCRSLGIRLLVVRGSALAARGATELGTLARLASREARLQGAALYWEDFEALLADDRREHLAAVLTVLDERAGPGPTFLAGSVAWEPKQALHGMGFVRLDLPPPGYDQRRELWRAAFAGHEAGLAPDVDLATVAGRFRLSGGQIEDAAATARNLALAREPARLPASVTDSDLAAACRLHSNGKLAELAQRITPRATWDDLVLPADRMAQLREIHDQARYRPVVYEAWGFGRQLALGKGLNVLFAGPPGTGKTMAADVLANALGLDLYKIDLASVASKYIGETEKNLARIFDEAVTSNAILFFDEADALFGKRTAVRDAHDRYANVEVSYLLQRMEQHEGVVVLATNLRRNMDEAFVRRLHATVEFPLPGVDERRRIWARIWPAPTPLDRGIDLDRLARDVELAGGAIRNIAVAGAFLAAANGGVVTMAHLRHATHREYQKIGKLQATRPSATDAAEV